MIGSSLMPFKPAEVPKLSVSDSHATKFSATTHSICTSVLLELKGYYPNNCDAR